MDRNFTVRCLRHREALVAVRHRAAGHQLPGMRGVWVRRGDIAVCCVSHFEASMVSAACTKARAAGTTMLASKCPRSARVTPGLYAATV